MTEPTSLLSSYLSVIFTVGNCNIGHPGTQHRSQIFFSDRNNSKIHQNNYQKGTQKNCVTRLVLNNHQKNLESVYCT